MDRLNLTQLNCFSLTTMLNIIFLLGRFTTDKLYSHYFDKLVRKQDGYCSFLYYLPLREVRKTRVLAINELSKFITIWGSIVF